MPLLPIWDAASSSAKPDWLVQMVRRARLPFIATSPEEDQENQEQMQEASRHLIDWFLQQTGLQEEHEKVSLEAVRIQREKLAMKLRTEFMEEACQFMMRMVLDQCSNNQASCDAAQQLLKAHRDTLALPMLHMMQLFDEFKEMRMGVPNLLQVELASQQAQAIACIKHHSSDALVAYATSGLHIPREERLRSTSNGDYSEEEEEAVNRDIGEPSGVSQGLLHGHQFCTELVISGLMECRALENTVESLRHEPRTMLARRFPPVPVLRSQLLSLAVECYRIAPLVTRVVPMRMLAETKWVSDTDKNSPVRRHALHACIDVCVAVPLESIATHLSRGGPNKHLSRDSLERLSSQYMAHARKQQLSVRDFHVQMQDILFPSHSRAVIWFIDSQAAKGKSRPGVMENAFPTIPICRVLAMLLTLPGCDKVLSLLFWSSPKRFVHLDRWLEEYTGLRIRGALDAITMLQFEAYKLEGVPDCNLLAQMDLSDERWKTVMSSPFAIGLDLFHDELIKTWVKADQRPTPFDATISLRSDLGTKECRKRIFHRLAECCYQAEGCKDLKKLIDLGPANPLCPIACHNPFCDRLGEVLKPHPHPKGVKSGWMRGAASDREWFFTGEGNSSVYIHSAKCWKNFLKEIR
ncbi:hypothetical protein DUNSADRAFT_9367 [Dunaliella salina]|uniref:Uncharacterized protein n=1 Tax=Dunaliella salina TaxID=3046 RepID=A0ABQ7H5H6_DUNSA|nr:hypothetical protein DUNSADRAFT_9367 [Dunaliella salina]|eukprot:KAF5842107.1 hypothetical protein DUNSADRAFT_9367 [Dunaliella salina]